MSKPKPKPTIASLDARLCDVEREQHQQGKAIAELRDGQVDANAKIDSIGDKLDLLLNLSAAKMAARVKVICTLLTAIGAVIGAAVGTACT